MNYIIGIAQQNAAGARLLPQETGRAAFLGAVTARWTQHDRMAYPFVHQVATQLREHDDREQFLAGIDIFLAGIESASAAVPTAPKVATSAPTAAEACTIKP